MYNAVCVKECPAEQSKIGESVKCMVNADVTSCPSALFPNDLIVRTCYPSGDTAKKITQQLMKELDEKNGFGQYILELGECSNAIIGMCFGTFVISAFYIFLLKWLTKPLLYTSMLLIFFGFLLLAVFLWMKKDEYSEEICGDVKNETTGKMEN